MTALRMSHRARGDRAAAGGVAHAIWLVVLGVIAAYAFLVALGAYSPGEVLGVTIVVAALAALWLLHGRTSRRSDDEGRARPPTGVQQRRGV
jgi:Flp pilus assembly protein TadB